MSGGGTQKSLRKALGALKDTTTVSLAKVNSDYKSKLQIMLSVQPRKNISEPFFLPFRLQDLGLMSHTASMPLQEGYQRHIIGRLH